MANGDDYNYLDPRGDTPIGSTWGIGNTQMNPNDPLNDWASNLTPDALNALKNQYATNPQAAVQTMIDNGHQPPDHHYTTDPSGNLQPVSASDAQAMDDAKQRLAAGLQQGQQANRSLQAAPTQFTQAPVQTDSQGRIIGNVSDTYKPLGAAAPSSPDLAPEAGQPTVPKPPVTPPQGPVVSTGGATGTYPAPPTQPAPEGTWPPPPRKNAPYIFSKPSGNPPEPMPQGATVYIPGRGYVDARTGQDVPAPAPPPASAPAPGAKKPFDWSPGGGGEGGGTPFDPVTGLPKQAPPAQKQAPSKPDVEPTPASATTKPPYQAPPPGPTDLTKKKKDKDKDDEDEDKPFGPKALEGFSKSLSGIKVPERKPLPPPTGLGVRAPVSVQQTLAGLLTAAGAHAPQTAPPAGLIRLLKGY